MMTKIVSTLISVAISISMLTSCSSENYPSGLPKEVKMDRAVLYDKIKGAWAGQTIGVSYGGPTEFKYQGRIIPDSVTIEWGADDCIKKWMDGFPGLYDDVYMDLTFVEIFDRLGIDAPVDSMAMAFANAGYMLWEANQTARYNVLNGIMPPASGFWKNNPHADDIDFQIEADFAGIMSPGMPNTAAVICDSIGHIMNYGDGWYGGVYMAAMYSLAFVSDSVEFVVTEALKCIPEASRYYHVIADVIDAYHNSPDDWTVAWQRCADNWDKTLCCPTGAYVPYNIDAALNSAYVVIGLLYGGGDFGKTLEIATRCGQDSDCNPASAGGILGTMLGYGNIPQEWVEPLKVVEDVKFAFTESSVNDACRMSFKHALKVIERNGGEVNDSIVTIRCQQPESVRFEQSFEGLEPLRKTVRRTVLNEGDFECGIEGNGIVITGGIGGNLNSGYIAEVEILLDGEVVETAIIPAEFQSRKYDFYWNYELDGKPHDLRVRLVNPNEDNIVVVHAVFEMKSKE
ncbi:MAG: ADP-ribosylglycohydrolase family protein [Muribaculaceae bacterium]|nr:ADP-ribosylglycohydrolase family protein [Muribaculaceae bacterium]